MAKRKRASGLALARLAVVGLNRRDVTAFVQSVSTLSELCLKAEQLLADLADERRRASDRARRANRTREARQSEGANCQENNLGGLS